MIGWMPHAPMKFDPAYLARVRRICLAMPGAIEKTAWGAPTFRAGPTGKVFAMFTQNHHGDGRIALWLFSHHDSQQLLVESDPQRFFVPPYVGKGGWIGVLVDKSPDALIEDCVRRAWMGASAKKPTGTRRGAAKRGGTPRPPPRKSPR
jgi:hypothetical protein